MPSLPKKYGTEIARIVYQYQYLDNDIHYQGQFSGMWVIHLTVWVKIGFKLLHCLTTVQLYTELMSRYNVNIPCVPSLRIKVPHDCFLHALVLI